MKGDRNNMKDNEHDFGTGTGPDFGTDSDVVPPSESDPRFDAWLAKMAPALNVPNAAPRAEMWDAIRAGQQLARDAQAGLVPGVTPLRRTWRLMSVIAAALLLGVAIDRLGLRKRDDTRVASVPVSPRAPNDSTTPSRLYRMAAAQTLTQAEALLVAYRASQVPQHDPGAARQLASWGRQVLSSTRLLLDSPAGEDPQLRPLLDDLELVLVQIIGLSGAPLAANERELIDRALQDRNLLPRIRTAVPATVAAAASSE